MLRKSVYKIAFISLVVFSLGVSASAYTSPGKPTGYVNDFARVLGQSDKQAIENKLQSLQQSTGVQVAVVTISALGNETVETYAVDLFQEWGIGQKGKDNGILILVAPNDRATRIEVGYGLEGTLTDLQAGIIVRNVMLPTFKTGDYNAGISGAVNAVSAIITGAPEAAEYLKDSGSSRSSTYSGLYESFGVILFIGVMILNLLARILGKTKSWWLGGVIGAVIGSIVGLFTSFIPTGIIAIVVLTILGLIFDYFISKRPPGSGGDNNFWPIFLGGGRGGSGGSGFGGFGGGMSGGGGASGRFRLIGGCAEEAQVILL